MKAGRWSTGIALLFFNFSNRLGWVFNATLPYLYPRELPGTHSTGGWVGPKAGVDGAG
jgi:hypothetical protein